MQELLNQNPTLPEIPIKTLNNIDNQRCLVYAVLFAQSNLKDSILKGNKASELYLDENTVFYLEDKTGRIPIVFSENFDKLDYKATGLVLGFIGYKTDKNSFACEDIVFPCVLNATTSHSLPEHKILFITIPLINNSNFYKLKIIMDLYSEKIKDIVIFGTLFDSDVDLSLFKVFEDIKLNIIIVPGPNDPTTEFLPQEPLHPMLLGNSSNIVYMTNPGNIRIGDKNYKLINSQVLKEYFKYGKNDDEYSVMKQIVKTRVLAPFCPDTLDTVPYCTVDPFILDDCEGLIFGGCSETFATQFEGTKIVSLERYSSDGNCIILDINSNNIEVVSIE